MLVATVVDHPVMCGRVAGTTSCVLSASGPDSLSSLTRPPWLKILPGLARAELPGLLEPVAPALGARNMAKDSSSCSIPPVM